MLTHVIVAECLYLPKSEIAARVDSIRESYFVHSRYEDVVPVNIVIDTEHYLGVPRYAAPPSRLGKKVYDETIMPELPGGPYKFLPSLYIEQESCVRDFHTQVAFGRTGFLLVAPTAFGKTIVLLKYMSSLNTPALVVVPRRMIIDQWIERIVEHTSLTMADVGRAQGPVCEYVGKAVVVGTVQSLWKDNYSAEFKKHFGVIVFDEIHMCAAQHYAARRQELRQDVMLRSEQELQPALLNLSALLAARLPVVYCLTNQMTLLVQHSNYYQAAQKFL